ncbi:helix-turn-helix domain-containing protein [Agrobacterium bohemicum]|uniref:helix-turn-helix domain-containing protein n=1 Tax=Agrobacterium bohemicum TaxID=2052828 RepID=UPI0009E7138E
MLRKERALALLSTSTLPIETIGQLVGFRDSHNFRRAFRRWTGTTPTDICFSESEGRI